MTKPLPSEDGSRPEKGLDAGDSNPQLDIDALLRSQRESIDRWSRAAGEAVRAEIEHAVVLGLTDAFRRLADQLPALLAASVAPPAAPSESTSLRLRLLAPEGETGLTSPPDSAAGSDRGEPHLSPVIPPLPAPQAAASPPLPVEQAAPPVTSSAVSEAATARLRRGHRCALAGALEAAITNYTEAIRLHPACAEAFLGRGESCRRLGRLELAAVDFRRSVALAPTLPVAHQLLGGVCLALGLWRDTVIAYDDAIRLDPGHAVSFLNRGLARAKVGEVGEAAADADAALRLNPDLDEAYYLRAVACTRQRRNDQAIADLTRLLQSNPGLWRAYYMRGLAQANEGDYDRAIADFGDALRLSPGLMAAHFQRAVAYRLKGEYTLAVRELTRFLQARPDSSRALFQRGLARRASGRHDQAVADFDQVLKLEPENQEARDRREEVLNDRSQELALEAKDAASGLEPKPADETTPHAASACCAHRQQSVHDAAAARQELGAGPIHGLVADVSGLWGHGARRISWKRLDRRFQCRRCRKVFYVDGQGRFSEVKKNDPRPRRNRLYRRLLTASAALAVGAVFIAWHVLWQRNSLPPPLPQDLEARGQLWGKAWISEDRYLMRRLTDPVSDRALFTWVRRHPPPHLADEPQKKSGGPDAAIEAHVARSAAHAAVLVIRINAPSLKKPVEVRQNWVERGEGWYFVPS